MLIIEAPYTSIVQQWLQEAWSPEYPVTMVVRTSTWAKGPFIFNTLTRVTAFIASLVIGESIYYIIMLNSLEKTLCMHQIIVPCFRESGGT